MNKQIKLNNNIKADEAKKLMKLRSSDGFTLIETIVAITILMISIVGPLALASKGIVYAEYVRDEITAYNLAQEAMETIRNIRDENISNIDPSTGKTEWLTDIKSKCILATCRLDIWDSGGMRTGLEDYSDTAVDLKDWLIMNILKVGDGRQGVLYGYDFNLDLIRDAINPKKSSLFTRKIIITEVPYSSTSTTHPIDPLDMVTYRLANPGEINVTVEVSWQRIPFLPRVIRISENLFSI